MHKVQLHCDVIMAKGYFVCSGSSISHIPAISIGRLNSELLHISRGEGVVVQYIYSQTMKLVEFLDVIMKRIRYNKIYS